MARWLILILRMGFSLLGVGLALSVAAALAYTVMVSDELPRLPDHLEDLAPPEQTLLLDRNGLTIDRVGSSVRVPLDQISPNFIEALLATEDRSFRTHHGISKRALLRVAHEMWQGQVQSGGSTLTQQLAKNLFFSFDKRIDRKLKEMLVAFEMESRYSKDDILLAYCNTVSFGSGCLGVESAAQEYFDKPAARLTRSEAAVLVGVLNAPGRYHPRVNAQRCLQKRNEVLANLLETGVITREEYERECSLSLDVHKTSRSRHGHLREQILTTLRKEFAARGLDPEALAYTSLIVRTTIDMRLQEVAALEVERQCAEVQSKLDPAHPLEGAFVAVDPYTGEVLAMVGGRDFNQSAFNCATGGNRQPGSAFKPIFYYTVLREGGSPLDMCSNSTTTYDIGFGQSWTPQNWDLSQGPGMTAIKGMMKSLNVVAAHMLFNNDHLIREGRRDGLLTTIRETAIDLGFNPATIEAVPSMILGTGTISPLQMSTVYSTFVNQGTRSDPMMVRRVEDEMGRVIVSFEPKQRQVLNPVESYLVLDMLKGAVRQGTGQSINSVPFRGELGGKTGTTNDYRDSWFCSVSPTLVTISWVGYLDNMPMKYRGRPGGVTGGTGGLPIFRGLLPEIDRLYYRDGGFRVPQGIHFRNVNLDTGHESPTGVPVALRMIDY
ncbi:MAG: transglycosylase domain-containing protein [Candidatus Delongbacteria bacterium]|nr:transglycosylase domain-containing protein [Candidatus Delongbacteria bacterium]